MEGTGEIKRNGDERISKEVAEEQFEEFLEYYDLDPEDDTSEEGNIKIAVEACRGKMIKAFHRGWFELEKDDRVRLFVNHNLRCKLRDDTSVLRYRPLNVKAKIAMKSGVRQARRGEEKTAQGNHEQIYSLLASLAGIDKSKIKQIEGPDVGLMEYLGGLFLLV
jgi:hypothetical protein